MFANVLYCMDIKRFSLSVIAEVVLNDCTFAAVLVQHAGFSVERIWLIQRNHI